MKALLVDDERLARAALRRLLKVHQDVMVIGEARNAGEAATQLRRLQPDVMFLDVEMPGTSGLELLERIPDVPPVIFTTAYSDYAMRAFEVSALDYLVKPIGTERLASALDKLRKVVAQREASTREARQIFLRDGEHCWIVAMDRIKLLESEGNYTRVYIEDHRPLIYTSLNALQARLDSAMFFRANRSHIVNLRKIVSVQPQQEGRLTAVLDGGPRVGISRRQSRKLRRLLSL